MFTALIVSVLAMASVAGSGATQVVLELMARSAVEQDGGVRTAEAPPAGPGGGAATRETASQPVLANAAAPAPAAPPAAVARTPSAPMPTLAAPDLAAVAPTGEQMPSPTLLALARDTPTRLPDGSIFLPMAIQHLIGLRTEISRVEPLAASF